MDHNPFLEDTRPKGADEKPAKGRIEFPGAVDNIVWQTRKAPPSDYENRLGDALETCFLEGIEDLEPLVARLNALGVPNPEGAPWTAESFARAMERLGG